MLLCIGVALINLAASSYRRPLSAAAAAAGAGGVQVDMHRRVLQGFAYLQEYARHCGNKQVGPGL